MVSQLRDEINMIVPLSVPPRALLPLPGLRPWAEIICRVSKEEAWVGALCWLEGRAVQDQAPRGGRSILLGVGLCAVGQVCQACILHLLSLGLFCLLFLPLSEGNFTACPSTGTRAWSQACALCPSAPWGAVTKASGSRTGTQG